MLRCLQKYKEFGLRRSVEAVILCHLHGSSLHLNPNVDRAFSGHPHVILLQNRQTQAFKLPGGRLRPGESDMEVLEQTNFCF